MSSVFIRKIIRSRIFRVSVLLSGALIALWSLTTTILLHTAFTPERLKSLIMESADRYLDAEVSFERVEVYAFSTFPQVGIRFTNGSLTTSRGEGQLSSIALRQDSVLSFSDCRVTVNPLSFLIFNTINIGSLLLENADIYAYIDESGRPNWDILKPDTLRSDTQTDAPGPDIRLRKIRVRDSDIIWNDRNKNLYLGLDSINASLSGALQGERNDLTLRLDTKEVIFWQDGKLLSRKLSAAIDTRLLFDPYDAHLRFEDTRLDLNGIRIAGAGVFRNDSEKGAIYTDTSFEMEVPSLETIMELIPKSLIREAVKVKAFGTIGVSGTLCGWFGNDHWPVLIANARIENGKAAYRGMAHRIDSLDTDFTARIDMNQPDSSHIYLRHFNFYGAGSNLTMTGMILNPVKRPVFQATVQADLDFKELSKIFPLKDSIQIKGKLKTDLRTDLCIADIQAQNWGKIDIEGEAQVKNIFALIPAENLEIRIPDARISFGSNLRDPLLAKTKLLTASVKIDSMRVKNGNNRFRMRKARMEIRTMPSKDTSEIFPLSARLNYSGLQALVEDTLGIRTGAAAVTVRIQPRPSDKRVPKIASTLRFDSLFIRSGSKMCMSEQVWFDIRSIRSLTDALSWNTDGMAGFDSLKLFVPEFPLPVTMSRTVLQMKEGMTYLDNATLRAGESGMSLTGKLENIVEAFLKEKEELRGHLKITSDTINCNQLMMAFEEGKRQERISVSEDEERNMEALSALESRYPEAADAPSGGVFIVPKKLDLVLDTDMRNVRFAELLIDRIEGGITIRNQCIELKDIRMHTLAADMATTLVYKAKSGREAYTGFDIDMKDILVGRLVEFIPSLDTLVPMLASLDGKVNFRMAAETMLDSAMNVVIPSIHGAGKIKGDSLVLMDGETFAEISRMLRFRNKERNLIDSMSVELTVRENKIEIYPFVVQVDRYKAAVGGQHHLDMTFNYHITVLESPVPFAMGINVTGNPDDFKYKLGKARYKDLKKSARQSPVDSTSLLLRSKIRKVVREAIRDDKAPRS